MPRVSYPGEFLRCICDAKPPSCRPTRCRAWKASWLATLRAALCLPKAICKPNVCRGLRSLRVSGRGDIPARGRGRQVGRCRRAPSPARGCARCCAQLVSSPMSLLLGLRSKSEGEGEKKNNNAGSGRRTGDVIKPQSLTGDRLGEQPFRCSRTATVGYS